MSIDFEIDNRGDFILSSLKKYPRLRLDFINSTYKTLRIDFEQNRKSPSLFKYEDKYNNGKRLNIEFYTDKDKASVNRKLSTVIDKDEIRQRIIIALRTEYGEAKVNDELGSYLVTQRHEDITSEDVHNNVRNIVLNAIGSYLNNPDVIVVPKRINGPFYCSNLNIYVYEDDELFFELEV